MLSRSLDWQARDRRLEDDVAALAAARAAWPLADPAFITDGDWRDLSGEPMTAASWSGADGFELRLAARGSVGLRIDRGARQVALAPLDPPETRP